MKNKRNGIVSLWKFIFAITILVYHSKGFYPNLRVPVFNSAYIACEFFFIIAGYYFAKSVLKETYEKETIGEDTFSFIKKRLKKLVPYMLIAYLIIIGIKVFSKAYVATSYYINSIVNLLLLKEFGFPGPDALGHFWFITALYMALFILYPLVKKHNKNFIYIASPIIVLFGMGYLFKNWGYLDLFHSNWNGFIQAGMIRGFAEVNLGMILYLISSRLKDVKYTAFGRLILTLLGEALLVMTLVVTSLKLTYNKYDFIILLFISLGILIITSEKTYGYKLLSNKLMYYLDTLSMVIFINHLSMIFLFSKLNIKGLTPNQTLLCTIGATIVFSIIEKAIIDSKLITFIKKISKKNAH